MPIKTTTLTETEFQHYLNNAGINGSEFDNEQIKPSRESYANAIALFNRELPVAPFKAQFERDAVGILDDAQEHEPTYFLSIELTSRAAAVGV